ncbi:MAG TPA: 2-oxoacid:acceptor oxidoreductase family protein [Thermodesulfovibrionales bacterium]|nr:2-oxoacid:acceptor oxidoreductase family protein [Thermodesulfovibrionales bacterium]
MGEVKIIVAGFGGQGILFLGRLITYGGMIGGKEVTCFPSYGAEMRGGTANCTAIISDEMIGSPIVRNPDILIAMNEASLKRFQPLIRPKGILIFESSLIKSPELRPDISSIGVPATEIASASRNSGLKSANMVMLGALLSATGLLSEESAIKALEALTPLKRKKTLPGNKEAIRKGIEYIADTKSKN